MASDIEHELLSLEKEHQRIRKNYTWVHKTYTAIDRNDGKIDPEESLDAALKVGRVKTRLKNWMDIKEKQIRDIEDQQFIVLNRDKFTTKREDRRKLQKIKEMVAKGTLKKEIYENHKATFEKYYQLVEENGNDQEQAGIESLENFLEQLSPPRSPKQIHDWESSWDSSRVKEGEESLYLLFPRTPICETYLLNSTINTLKRRANIHNKKELVEANIDNLDTCPDIGPKKRKLIRLMEAACEVHHEIPKNS